MTHSNHYFATNLLFLSFFLFLIIFHLYVRACMRACVCVGFVVVVICLHLFISLSMGVFVFVLLLLNFSVKQRLNSIVELKSNTRIFDDFDTLSAYYVLTLSNENLLNIHIHTYRIRIEWWSRKIGPDGKFDRSFFFFFCYCCCCFDWQAVYSVSLSYIVVL